MSEAENLTRWEGQASTMEHRMELKQQSRESLSVTEQELGLQVPYRFLSFQQRYSRTVPR